MLQPISITAGCCPRCNQPVPCFCSSPGELSSSAIAAISQPVTISRDHEILAALKDIRKELKTMSETLRLIKARL